MERSVSEGRRAALAILREVGRGRRLDRAFAERARTLDERERRWVHEATFGTVRMRGRLDHLLDLNLRKGRSSVSPLVLDLLRLGAYQLVFMDAVPAFAAVSETVNQARAAAGPGAASLVNGVLRSLQREGADPSLFPDPRRDAAGYLSTWGSHPRWLVDRWRARWSDDDVTRLVEENNRRPPLCLRPLGVDEREALRRLADRGIGATPVGSGTGCLVLEEGASPSAALDAVPGTIQDPGSALVTRYAAPEPGSRVADLCAAPGGKALALAQGASYVVAADRNRARIELVGESALRLGARVGLVVADAAHPPVVDLDLVLLDVPCTGTGTFRRHPDARWRLSPADVDMLARTQEALLEGARSAVRRGGLLVYSTCTLEPEENEQQVDRFLERHPDFLLEPGTGVKEEFVDRDGHLRVLPQRTGFDGAFAARFRRVA